MRPAHLQDPPSRLRSFVGSTQNPRAPRNEIPELLLDIDGVRVLMRFLVTDADATIDLDRVANDRDFRSLLSSTLEKMASTMRGMSLQRDDSSEQTLAVVELIPGAEHSARRYAPSNDTVLRVGPLELDLLNRTAMRGGRRIDLRPREFLLLKYMMERSDQLLTRASFLKEVWNYKFIPKTNVVDVHMGKLRRKIERPNEPALIRNVRGLGFVLSATPLSQCSSRMPVDRVETRTLAV